MSGSWNSLRALINWAVSYIVQLLSSEFRGAGSVVRGASSRVRGCEVGFSQIKVEFKKYPF